MARFGYIQVIRRCNQRCLFCSNPDNDAILPLDEVRRLLDDFAGRGFRGVLLTGGEPTLHPQLPAILAAARATGLPSRVITNGQRTADRAYLETLVAAGLEHVHVSIQSHRAGVQAALVGKADSLPCLERSLAHLGKLGVTTDVNTTIGTYNADHLDETVVWLTERFPWLHHWVWNNLDPSSDRCQAHPEVIAAPHLFELSLARAMRHLHRNGRSFRVERVPLCYMTDFAHCSTEARKLVKRESRELAFLDERGHVDDAMLWKEYSKADACRICTVNAICPGLFAVSERHDFRDELYPLFVSRERIERRVGPAQEQAP